MKVLVTGANGLLGREVVRQLALEGHETVLGVSERSPEMGVGLDQVVLNAADGSFEAKLPAQLDSIIHLAQSRKFKEFPQYAGEVFKTNVWLTQSLLEHAQRKAIEKFVLASSGSVYKTKKFGWLNERSALIRPGEGSHYAASKLSAELITQSYSHLMGVQVLRFFYIYGPGQNREMLIPRLVEKVRSEERVWLEGRKGLQFNPVHVTDAARAVLAALDLNGSHRLNIAGPQATNLREVLELVGQILGKPASLDYQRIRSPKALSSTKLMEELLGRPLCPPKEGLESIVGHEEGPY